MKIWGVGYFDNEVLCPEINKQQKEAIYDTLHSKYSLDSPTYTIYFHFK